MSLSTLLVSVALLSLQDPGLPPRLSLGVPVEGELTDSAPEVHTPTLDAGYTDAPTLGVAYHLVVDEPGPYHIDLHSYDFDAYLILRDGQGEPIAEDDDGLISAHARLLVTLEAGTEYFVSACALHGARGAYSLELVAVAPAPVSATEQARLDLEQARAVLAHVEANHGPENPRTAASLDNLAGLLQDTGEYAQAKPLLERALAIRAAQLGPEHPDTAASLNNLAALLHSMGEYAQAKLLLERTLAIDEAQLGPEHPNTAASLNNLAGLLHSMGEYAQAKPLFERALAIYEAQLGPEHPDTATGLNNLAGLLGDMGEYAQAKPLFERALAIYEAQLGPEHPDTATSQNNLASLLYSMGEYAQAKPLYERALAIHEAQLGPEHPRTATSLSGLAVLLGAMGEYAQAKPLYERALAINEAQLGPEHPDTATSLNYLALLLQDMGEYAQAKPLYERALAIREAQLGPEHPDTATSLNNLASLLRDMGEYAQAKPLYERALAIDEAQLGPEHPSTATSLNNLAVLLRAMDEDAKAKPLYERALAIREAQLGPEHPSTALGLNNLAVLLKDMGEYAQAKPLYERALAIWEAQLGPEHPRTAGSLNNLARLLQDTGEYAQAKPLLERALAIYEAQLGPEHPHTAWDLNNLVRLLLDLRQPADAWELVRRGQVGMRAHLGSLLASRTRDESKQYLSKLRWQEELLLSIPRVYADPEVEADAASSLLVWKGQVGRVARAVHKLARESDEARELSARLGARQRELSGLAYDTELNIAAREQRLEQVRREIVTLDVALREMVGVDDLDALDVAALREHVPADAALLSFFVHGIYEPARYEDDKVVERGHWSEEHLVAWVVRPGAQVVSVDLGLADPIEEQTKVFLEGLVGTRGVLLVGAGEDRNQELRAALWDPLVESLADASLVIVSQDRFTATLPFEVLMGKDGRYLVEDRSFVYLHDLQAIGGFEQVVSHNYDSLFCVGGVDFNERDEPELLAAATVRGEEQQAPTERWEFWGSLDQTRSEVATIRDLHKAFVRAGARVVVTGTDATEERVIVEMPRASVVHLATHGYFRPQGLPSMWQAALDETERQRDETGGMRGGLLTADRKLTGYLPEVLSGLVFAGANLERKESRLDGYLTASDVEWLDLTGVELVTLSACKTGLGRSASGEGMSGFRTSLLRAGAKTVVTSLWQVPDDATERLMARFYENLLRNKMGKLAALREAQLWMLRENRRTYDGNGRPFTWGAFVLSGDWR